MKNIQNLTIDINKKPFQTITANTGEVGSRFIKITILDNSTPVDLTGITVYIYAKKPDGTKLFNTVKIEDAANGIILAELTSQVLAVEGIVKLNLLLTENGKKLKSKQFLLNVDRSILDEDAIESSNEFGALTRALDKVDEWNGYFDETSGKIEEKYTERLNKVDSQLEQKANNIDVNSKVWSMANMGQDVKEAMTGGSVAVVGKNSVLAENIVNGEILPSKLSNITVGKNKFNKNAVTYGCYYDGSTGVIKQGASGTGLNCISEVIPCEAGKAYYRNKSSNVIYWNSAMEYVGRESVLSGAFTPVENACYMGFSLVDTNVETFQVHEGSTSLTYEPYTVICNDYAVYGTNVIDIMWYRTSLLNFEHSGTTITVKITGASSGGIYIQLANRKVLYHNFLEDIEFVINHDEGWVYNIFTDEFRIVSIGSASTEFINSPNGDILLLGNLSGRVHCGALYKEYIYKLSQYSSNISDIWIDFSMQNSSAKTNVEAIDFVLSNGTVKGLYNNGKFLSFALSETTFTLENNQVLVADLINETTFIENVTKLPHLASKGYVPLVVNRSARIRGGVASHSVMDLFNRDLWGLTDNYLNIVDVYSRYENGLNIKTSGTNITFTIDLAKVNPWTIYTLNVAGIYNKYIANVNWVETEEGETSTELVYILAHNGMLILDTINKKVKVEDMTKYKVDYSTNKDILLALNIDGKIVAGELKEDFNDILRQQESKVVATNEKCDIGKFKFKFDVDLPSSYMSSHSLVDDELWIFPVSNDEGTNTATCVRYRVDFENNNAELVGSFTHNWGHVNSSSYSPLTDSIICGNGSGSYNLMGQIFIFENARSFRDRSNVNRNEAIIIDVQEFGCKCNVVWGEANGGKGNICYVVSNDNQNIRKLLLGQGANQFENGVFLEGKTGLQFNGTYKILGEWTMPRIDVNQGTNYENGALYIGLGHDTIWFTKNSLNDDGTVYYETYKEYRYDDTGAIIKKNMQGITVTDKYIIVAQDSGTHEILVYYK